MRLRITYILSAAMLFALHCGAQGIVVPQYVLDSIAAPPMAEDRALIFDRTDIVSIKISENDAPEDYRFTFSNRGDRPLVVTRVETSCGCAAASYDKRPVQPGGKGSITITYDPKGRPGRLASRIFVFTDTSGTRPAARLTLEGEVSPAGGFPDDYRIAMGCLHLKSKSVSLDGISRTASLSERIECFNSGDKPLRLRAMAGMTPDWISFRTEPEVIEAGQRADLVITVNGPRLPAGMKGDVTHMLVIEGIDARPSERSLQVAVHMTQDQK